MALVAFDFDGTLSQSDMTVLLGEEAGVGDEVSGLLEQGRRGDLTVEDSLRQRVALLEGLQERQVETALGRLSLRPGAADLIGDLRRSGHHVAILTRSFERGVERALADAGVVADDVVANRLVVDNDALTGDLEGPLLEETKAGPLGEIATREGIDPGQAIAVGNSRMDLPMLQVAGTAVGFDPDAVVERQCDVVVTSMRRLRLYLEQHGIVDPDPATES